MKKIKLNLKQLFLAVFLLLFLNAKQICSQPILWGMTSKGGAYSFGTIFKMDVNGNNQTIEHSFFKAYGQHPSNEMLCEANNGKLYGTTINGGTNNNGVIFEYDPLTFKYTKKFDFGGNISGKKAIGSLIQANNGKLYGTTNEGGINNIGVLFEYDIATSLYTKLYDFDLINGSSPRTILLQATNGKIYGTTSVGGVNNKGVLFEYDILTNVYSKKHDFTFESNPGGGLMQATNGKIYGTGGGWYTTAYLFEYDINTSSIIIKTTFNGITNGGSPSGSLIQANNGKLYGLSHLGGANDEGVLYEYDIIAAQLTTKIDFSATNGRYPRGGLLQASNGKFYGMTSTGGINDSGVLFEYNLSNNTYIIRTHFNYTNGLFPDGKLIQATNGKLYGVTPSGGIVSSGVLFEYNTSTSLFTKKIDFDYDINGFEPTGSLVRSSNNKLYGTTKNSGNTSTGILFEYDPITSIYIVKKHFNYNVNGAFPEGDLIEVNGKLYGTTTKGGVGSQTEGVLFEYNPSTNTLTNKFNFSSNNGKSPSGNLILANNGKLYGTTIKGGTFDNGVLYEYDIINSTFTKKIDFNGTNGKQPTYCLTKTSNGILYGLTKEGGISNEGVLFEYNPSTSVLTKKIDFYNAIGKFPCASLVEFNNGKLYGTASEGGNNSLGTLFEYDPNSSSIIKKIDFDGINYGSNPKGTLMLASNGKIYGMTSSGGNNNYGILFEYDPNVPAFFKKMDFNDANGKFPIHTKLIEFPPVSTSFNETILSESHGYTFPNPSKGIFNIETNTNDKIIITDVFGKEIVSKTCTSNKEIIDLNNETSGIYIIKITDEKGILTIQKIIKE